MLGETDVNSFSGVGSADGVNSPIGGDASIDVCQYHPADNNPGNFAIAANEVTAYASAWKRGDNWPIDPNPIPADYITRAGALWKRGENYKLDPTVLSGPPLWWVNVLVPGQSVLAQTRSIAKQAFTADSIAVSALPGAYAPNIPFTVTIAVKPDSTVTSYVVEDQTPLGWVVSDIDNSGSFDTNNRKVKWGLFFDNTPRTLAYQITPPSTVSGTATFTGLASFDGVNITITGQRSTTRTVTTNTPPTISSITDLTINQNGTLNVEFSIDDVETPNSLTVSSSSSNPVLVPNANITFGGSGPFRTVIITPAINQTGTATITVTVSDGSLAASNSFVFDGYASDQRGHR